jgi:3-hydroxybutyryl-CoA dehydrogenase
LLTYFWTLKNISMKNISVIGAGTMGNGIAHVFAQYGFKVQLIDVKQESLDKAIATISKNLDRQVSKGTLTEEGKAATLANLNPITDLASGVSQADLVVEAATENVDLKLKIFRDMDAAAPAHCILKCFQRGGGCPLRPLCVKCHHGR